MITVSEAENFINSHQLDLHSEEIPLSEANGRVLTEEIHADRDFPPFNRVTMDGIAIKFSDWRPEGPDFIITGTQAAGSPPLQINSPNSCIEVMTGAVLPEGADTVIPYEVINIKGEKDKSASILVSPKKGQNVHKQGSDRRTGSAIISPYTSIGAPEIGIAATVGKSTLSVLKPPSVAIIATGDELVPIDQTPLPHQIRSSNAATLSAAFEQWNVNASLYHIVDDLKGTTEKLGELINSFQILVLSGGVSKGKFDYVPQALDQLGVNRHFHRIQQRPGKPFWFGSHASGTVVFAFPGNPVSSFMCFNRYLKPWLDKAFHQNTSTLTATLTEDIHFNPDLTYFAQVKISLEQGHILAHPVEGHGSGDLANLVDADGFLELPQGPNHYLKGEIYPLYRYRDL